LGVIDQLYILYLSFPIASSGTVAHQITEDLWNVAAWCYHNSLLINTDMTKLLLFGTHQMTEKIPESFHILLTGKDFLLFSSAKDFGKWMDSFLNYDQHIISQRLWSALVL
jgi:hypothetical protein